MLRRREFLASLTAPGTAGARERSRALIIDGVNNHDWQTATRAIREILTASGLFEVEVSTTQGQDGWSPDFSRFQVVINNFNGGHKEDGIRWPRRVEESFEKYVRDGGGMVVFHAANNAFLKWDAYNEMIGLGWRDKSFGPGLAVGEDGRVVEIPRGTGLEPGHGPRHDFRMHVVDRGHPITRGLPSDWMHPSEQLTHGQHGPAHGLHVLTCAKSEISGKNEPMDWVSQYGNGRVYTTMLGHTWRGEPNPNLEDVWFRKLFTQGVAWAAGERG